MLRLRPAQRGIALVPILVVVVVLLVLWFSRHFILGGFGTFLDVGDEPQKAEAAVVLAGGWTGERVLKGGDLVRQGFVPFALLSGPNVYYERAECDYSIPFAIERGYAATDFECVQMSDVHSTEQEAAVMIEELRRRGLKKVLLVTSDFHTRRARRFYKAQAPDIEFVIIGVPMKSFELKHWYSEREGWKTVSLEWLKLVTSLAGI